MNSNWLTALFLLISFQLEAQLQWVVPAKNGEQIYYSKHYNLIVNKDNKSSSFDGALFDYNSSIQHKVISHYNGQYISIQENQFYLSEDLTNFTSLDINTTIAQVQAVFKEQDTVYICHNNGLEKHVLNATENQVSKHFENDIYKAKLKAIDGKGIFVILNNLIFNTGNLSTPIHIAKDPILDFEIYSDQFILSTENNIYLSDQSRMLELYAAIDTFPNPISTLLSHNDLTLFVSKNSLYKYHWKESSVDKIGSIEGDFQDWLIDPWDQLWILSDVGIQKMPLSKNSIPPSIRIESILDDNGKNYSTEKIRVDESASFIDIHFKTQYLPDPQNVITDYMLNQNTWSNTQKSPLRIYTDDLHASSSALKIRVGNQHKNYSIPLQITIEKQGTKGSIGKAWIVIFSLLGLLLLISLLSLFNLRNKEENARLELEKLRSEKSLYLMQQQFHELQIRPHFIFNALNSIQGLVSTDQNQKAKESIVLISRFLRNFLYHSDSSMNAVEDEVKLLKDYMELEKLCRNHSFDYSFVVEEGLMLEEIPNMIIQPIIENCIIHGFKNIDYPGLIEIEFLTQEEYIVCIVKDNGKGIQENLDKSHKSMALNLIEKRLSYLDKNRKEKYLTLRSDTKGTTATLFFR